MRVMENYVFLEKNIGRDLRYLNTTNRNRFKLLGMKMGYRLTNLSLASSAAIFQMLFATPVFAQVRGGGGCRASICVFFAGLSVNSNSWAQSLILAANGQVDNNFSGLDVSHALKIPSIYFQAICLKKPRPKVNQ